MGLRVPAIPPELFDSLKVDPAQVQQLRDLKFPPFFGQFGKPRFWHDLSPGNGR